MRSARCGRRRRRPAAVRVAPSAGERPSAGAALGPSGAFGRFGPAEAGPTEATAAAAPELLQQPPGSTAAAAPGEVEGYGAQGPGAGAPGGVAQGAPRIRVATLGASCCAPLPVTQAHNIGIGKPAAAHGAGPALPGFLAHSAGPPLVFRPNLAAARLLAWRRCVEAERRRSGGGNCVNVR